ncbi:putative toxin-antitoxin system toxin component, PIN family [Candidatus Uhrbacteria bacterium]|nr:putative toxin-antitoxin system toxin component, PIN family [Candidatus Uhrbacteria bacterium]
MDLVVLDTNVLVSAFFTPHGLTSEIFDALELGRFELIISEYIINELTRVLENKLQIRRDLVSSYLDELRYVAAVVKPVSIRTSKLDPNDWPILGTALAGRATYLVSGDKKFLSLKKFRLIKILSPREFIDEVTYDGSNL